jgi:mono/diheme cytochrome c family protein
LRLGLTLTSVLFAILTAACQPESVVDNAVTKSATPVAKATAAPEATPTVQPADSAGQTPPPQTGERKAPAISNIPFTTAPYKPSPSPTPDKNVPPPPKPKVVNGKIVQEWQAPPEAAKLVNPFKDDPEAVKLGRTYYMQRCEACHNKDGHGGGWMATSMAKSMRKLPTDLRSAMTQANTDGELFWKITHGNSPMPANRERFDDNQRWQIVTFLRTLKK